MQTPVCLSAISSGVAFFASEESHHGRTRRPRVALIRESGGTTKAAVRTAAAPPKGVVSRVRPTRAAPSEIRLK